MTVAVYKHPTNGAVSLVFTGDSFGLVKDYERARITVTPEYIIIRKTGITNGRRVSKGRRSAQIYCTELDNRLNVGRYKLYKHRDGLAFKRWENEV